MPQQADALTFQPNTYYCHSCGKQHYEVSISQKVAITPDGANDELPPLPAEVEITDSALLLAIGIFDTLVDGYTDLLFAEVINMSTTDILETISQGYWVWNQKTKKYRNTDTGEVITERKLIGIRDLLIVLWLERVQRLAQNLSDGVLTIQEWTLSMRREVFSVFADEYMLAKGGWNAMYPADIDALTLILNEQYGHLQGFASDVQDGTLSKSQISARSELYMNSATQAHERGKARRHNLILPAYPADGSQICRSNCKCKWFIREDDRKWDATWELDPSAEHCETCLSNANVWAPWTVFK